MLNEMASNYVVCILQIFHVKDKNTNHTVKSKFQ